MSIHRHLQAAMMRSGDPDVMRYLSAVQAADGRQLEIGVQSAIRDFILGCKADGIWDAIKASCILAGARTLAGALVPLKGAAPTPYGFDAADYNRETGLKGNGSTKYIDSKRANNADGRDDQHVAAWASSVPSAASAEVIIGCGDSATTGSTQVIFGGASTPSIVFRSRVVDFDLHAGAFQVGLYGVSRNNSANYAYAVPGTVSTFTRASQEPTTTNLLVYARGAPLAPLNLNPTRAAFYSIGSAIDLSKLRSRVSSLMTAIGEAI